MNDMAHQMQPVIRPLDEAAINRIAAGEVVERPASAVKELVENALDAGARRVAIDIAAGGRTLIRVGDDGCGMLPADLPLAVARHATSKTDGADLLDIRSFGFRGEALASMGAVGRLRILSRAAGAEAAEIAVEHGRIGAVRPAAAGRGTTVELRDLFQATPARLKFLRSERAELQAIHEVVRRLALAEPAVDFTLRDVTDPAQPRTILRAEAGTGDLFAALHARVLRLMGPEFAADALAVDLERDGLRLTGYAALPTHSRGAAVAQHLCVNGRPVQDRMLTGALRAAYFDLLPRDRHPAAVLNLHCPPERVDVNVHPAKAEVRFREPEAVRGLIVGGLRSLLAGARPRGSAAVAQETLAAMRPDAPRVYQMELPARPSYAARSLAYEAQAPWPAEPGFAEAPPAPDQPLGMAKAQLHGTWIVAQTAEGMAIVDMHAAHERLVYERLKAQAAAGRIPAQALLIPEIVDLPAPEAARLMALAPDLAALGLEVEGFGPGAIAVRATPAILGPVQAAPLIRDLLDELADTGTALALKARIDAVLSRMACHGSVRSGRAMRVEEMDALLREIEATPNAGQCNHGRPTFVTLRLADIERLFGRR